MKKTIIALELDLGFVACCLFLQSVFWHSQHAVCCHRYTTLDTELNQGLIGHEDVTLDLNT